MISWNTTRSPAEYFSRFFMVFLYPSARYDENTDVTDEQVRMVRKLYHRLKTRNDMIKEKKKLRKEKIYRR